MHSSSPKNNFVVRNGTDDDEDEELSKPPARPSVKALGKRREIPKETCESLIHREKRGIAIPLTNDFL